MSKQPINSKFDIEQILTAEEVTIVKKIVSFLNASLKEAHAYDEVKQPPPLYIVELKIYAEVLLNSSEITILITTLSAFKELAVNANHKKILKQIIKKLEKERG